MEQDFSHAVIGAAVEVQRMLGSGLLESAYSAALAIEFADRGIAFQQEEPIAGEYKGRTLGVAYRADFIVERSLVLEVKALDTITDIHRAQLVSYLRLSKLRIGLLINFHAFPVSTKGVHRVVNNFGAP